MQRAIYIIPKRKEVQGKSVFGTVNQCTPASTSRQPVPLILGVARLLNEGEVPARRKTYRKRMLRRQRTSSEASLRPNFSGSRREMQSAQLSPLQPNPSEHALETWVFVKPLACSAVRASKVTDDMFIRYTRKLLQRLHSLATCTPVDLCYF